MSLTYLEDMVMVVYENKIDIKNRCIELATLVRDEMIKSKESMKDENDFVDIRIRIRLKHKNFIHRMSKSAKTSLENMIRMILLKYISDKGNITIDYVKENKAAKQSDRK